MDEARRWRPDAPVWVHGAGVLITAGLGVLTLGAVVAGAATGAVHLALLPAGVTALAGRLTAAWRRGRPWSWWGWAVTSTGGIVLALGSVLGAGPSWGSGAAFLVSGLLLILVCRPDARVRADGPVPELVTLRSLPARGWDVPG